MQCVASQKSKFTVVVDDDNLHDTGPAQLDQIFVKKAGDAFLVVVDEGHLEKEFFIWFPCSVIHNLHTYL
jgi:hypothetical protein